MPLVEIQILEGRSADEKRALFDAVHSALMEALKIPDDDRLQRLIEHASEDFEVPSPGFTIVRITMFPGRSSPVKRTLYQAIVRNLGELGIAGNDVFIVVEEPALQNWGIRGGTPANELQLDLDLNI
jgi:phenylpyruvate tautomerase PptA (4-oxalocrotonate tautomerase family)